MLKLIVAPLVLTSALPPAYSKERKKNILFISVDDMNNDLGCYGHPIVKSPGIDRLASNGIAFANAYCQFPLSSPSRSSMLTGMRPDKTRVFDLTVSFQAGSARYCHPSPDVHQEWLLRCTRRENVSLRKSR